MTENISVILNSSPTMRCRGPKGRLRSAPAAQRLLRCILRLILRLLLILRRRRRVLRLVRPERRRILRLRVDRRRRRVGLRHREHLRLRQRLRIDRRRRSHTAYGRRAGARSSSSQQVQRTPRRTSCEVMSLTVIGLLTRLRAVEIDDVAGHAVAEIEIAIAEFDREILRRRYRRRRHAAPRRNWSRSRPWPSRRRPR